MIIGESCTDVFHYGSCKRLCPEAPVPVFNSSGIASNGGMAMNVYNNVNILGGNPNLITNTNWESITKTRFVDHRTNHMFMRLDENDKEYGRCDVEALDFDSYDAVIVSDYNKGFLTMEDLGFISRQHHLVFLDTKKILGKWCKDYSFIKINIDEYERTKDTVDEQIRNNLIITKGSDGCSYRGKDYKVPLVEVKDTSGAGDTFISGLCVEYCRTRDIEASLKFANDCSTQVVQKMGVATL